MPADPAMLRYGDIELHLFTPERYAWSGHGIRGPYRSAGTGFLDRFESDQGLALTQEWPRTGWVSGR